MAHTRQSRPYDGTLNTVKAMCDGLDSWPDVCHHMALTVVYAPHAADPFAPGGRHSRRWARSARRSDTTTSRGCTARCGSPPRGTATCFGLIVYGTELIFYDSGWIVHG